MKRIFFTFFAAFCLINAAFAQQISTELVERFAAQKVKIQRQTVRYRVATTADDSAEKPILVVYFHNSKAKGKDNLAQLDNPNVPQILNFLDSTKTKAHFVVPQCPKKRRWSEPEYENREMQAIIHKFIAQYVAENDLDPSRVYILGASSGGAGVWKLMNDYHTFYAAGMVVGSYPRYVVDRVVCKTPLCCVVGEADNIATPAELTKYTDRLKAMGGTVRYEILPCKNHPQTVAEGFRSDLLQWLFEQRNTRLND